MRALFSWAGLQRRLGAEPLAVRRARRAADPKHAADFADYGTAYGLDLSVDTDPASHSAEPAPASAPTPRKAVTR